MPAFMAAKIQVKNLAKFRKAIVIRLQSHTYSNIREFSRLTNKSCKSCPLVFNGERISANSNKSNQLHKAVRILSIIVQSAGSKTNIRKPHSKFVTRNFQLCGYEK